jgi:hypothetical protein
MDPAETKGRIRPAIISGDGRIGNRPGAWRRIRGKNPPSRAIFNQVVASSIIKMLIAGQAKKVHDSGS